MIYFFTSYLKMKRETRNAYFLSCMLCLPQEDKKCQIVSFGELNNWQTKWITEKTEFEELILMFAAQKCRIQGRYSKQINSIKLMFFTYFFPKNFFTDNVFMYFYSYEWNYVTKILKNYLTNPEFFNSLSGSCHT